VTAPVCVVALRIEKVVLGVSLDVIGIVGSAVTDVLGDGSIRTIYVVFVDIAVFGSGRKQCS